MNLTTILGVVLAIAWLFVLYKLDKKEVKFAYRVLSSLGVGLILGILFKDVMVNLKILGDIYISFIKMLVMPLVVTLIIVNLTSFKGDSIKKITLTSIFFLMFTTLLACIVGVLLGGITNLGEGITLTQGTDFVPREIPTFQTIIKDMLPSNPFEALSTGKVLPVIIFSVVISIAINMEEKEFPEEIKNVKNFFLGFEKILFRAIRLILRFTPFGVFGLIGSTAATQGISTLIPLGKYIVVLYIACLIQILVVDAALIALIAKMNPYKFFKKIYPAQLVAFTTCSSYGTLPVTIKSLVEEVKISEKIASFTASLGTTMGMNACGGIYPVIVAIFVANAFGIDLTFGDYALLILVTPLSSIGTAGIPGTASMMATIVLTTLGLPIEGLALILSVDPIIDMIRTATNITGAATSALLVEKTLENK